MPAWIGELIVVLLKWIFSGETTHTAITHNGIVGMDRATLTGVSDEILVPPEL